QLEAGGVDLGPTRDRSPRRDADVGTVQAEADASSEGDHVILGQTGIGARRASLRTVEQGLDGCDERGIERAPHGRVGGDLLVGVHGSFSGWVGAHRRLPRPARPGRGVLAQLNAYRTVGLTLRLRGPYPPLPAAVSRRPEEGTKHVDEPRARL